MLRSRLAAFILLLCNSRSSICSEVNTRSSRKWFIGCVSSSVSEKPACALHKQRQHRKRREKKVDWNENDIYAHWSDDTLRFTSQSLGRLLWNIVVDDSRRYLKVSIEFIKNDNNRSRVNRCCTSCGWSWRKFLNDSISTTWWFLSHLKIISKPFRKPIIFRSRSWNTWFTLRC